MLDLPNASPVAQGGAPLLDEATAREVLARALEAYFAEPGMPWDVNERAATHRIALYLEREVRALPREVLGADPSEVFVDCEYNRQGNAPKRLQELARRLVRIARRGKRSRVADTRGTTVFPDVIAHRRGEGGPNLLVVEVKRPGAVEGAVAFDKEKLHLYRQEHRYLHAFLVTLGRSMSETEVVAVGQPDRPTP
jgi:hypothetical protein